MLLKHGICIPLSSNDASSYQRLLFDIVEPDKRWHFVRRLHGYPCLKARSVWTGWFWTIATSWGCQLKEETLALGRAVLSDLANEQENLWRPQRPNEAPVPAHASLFWCLSSVCMREIFQEFQECRRRGNFSCIILSCYSNAIVTHILTGYGKKIYQREHRVQNKPINHQPALVQVGLTRGPRFWLQSLWDISD